MSARSGHIRGQIEHLSTITSDAATSEADGLRFVRRRLRPRGCRWGMIRQIWPDLQQTLELGVVETVSGRDSGKLVQPRARPQSAEGGVD